MPLYILSILAKVEAGANGYDIMNLSLLNLKKVLKCGPSVSGVPIGSEHIFHSLSKRRNETRIQNVKLITGKIIGCD